MFKKYLAEFVGTFALAFVVLLAVSSLNVGIAVPIIAGLTLGLFVYTIGSISGCHINPSVTIAQWSIKKISARHAGYYIIAQILGGLVALWVAGGLKIVGPVIATAFSGKLFFAELLGALFFNFGIAAVVYGKAKEQMSGVVVGSSLLFGILLASLIGSAGILNPAVSIALNAFSWLYVISPIVGAVLGAKLYQYVAGER